MRPARPVRRRNLPDLARYEPQAPAVKRLAERNRDVAGPIPAQLDHQRLVAGKPQRRR
jgi:hypothetical protein